MRTLQVWLDYYGKEYQRSPNWREYYASVHALLRLALSYKKIDLNDYLRIIKEVEDEIRENRTT